MGKVKSPFRTHVRLQRRGVTTIDSVVRPLLSPLRLHSLTQLRYPNFPLRCMATISSGSSPPDIQAPSQIIEQPANSSGASSALQPPYASARQERFAAWQAVLLERRRKLSQEAERQMTVLGSKINEITGYKEVERLKTVVHQRGRLFISAVAYLTHPPLRGQLKTAARRRQSSQICVR